MWEWKFFDSNYNYTYAKTTVCLGCQAWAARHHRAAPTQPGRPYPHWTRLLPTPRPPPSGARVRGVSPHADGPPARQLCRLAGRSVGPCRLSEENLGAGRLRFSVTSSAASQQDAPLTAKSAVRRGRLSQLCGRQVGKGDRRQVLLWDRPDDRQGPGCLSPPSKRLFWEEAAVAEYEKKWAASDERLLKKLLYSK